MSATILRVRRAVLLAGAIGLLFAGCSDGQVGRSDNSSQAGYIEGNGTVGTYSPKEREPAPDFSGPLLDGGQFDLAAALGDVVVLNIWGSWCPPCRKEAPELQAVSEKLAGLGVRFVGVNTRDPDERAPQAFEDEFGITYPSVYDPKGDALLAFRTTLPPSAIPSTLVIDRQGRIAARVLGAIGEASLTELVTDIAAEDATAS